MNPLLSLLSRLAVPPTSTDPLQAFDQRTPAIPGAWWLALVQAAIATAVAFGVNLNTTQQTALLTLAGVIGTAIVAADLSLRRGRLQHLVQLLGPGLDLNALYAELEAARQRRPSPAAAVAPVSRVLTAVEKTAADEATTQKINDPAPPPPGTYPTDEPTGS